jgi:hypothetical protein
MRVICWQVRKSVGILVADLVCKIKENRECGCTEHGYQSLVGIMLVLPFFEDAKLFRRKESF